MESNSSRFEGRSDERGGQLALPGENASGSPFDALRQVDERGEFWSARDVMPHLDYEQWRRFEDSIERAMAACRNSGDKVEDHFATSGKITINARGHKRVLDDYRLSRHGAYLVAINGDSRKDAIAKAQTYFAQQTRKQELAEQAAEVVASPRPSMDLANIHDIEQIGIALMRAVEIAKHERVQREIEAAGRRAAEEENAILGPKAAEADHIRSADGLMTLSDFANKLKSWAVQNLGVTVKHKEVFDFLSEINFICRGDSLRNNRPKAFAIDRDFIRQKETEYPDKNGKMRVSYSSRLTPSGCGWAWDRAVTRLNDFGTLRKPMGGAA